MGLSLANIYELKRLQENNKIKVHFISEGTPPSKSSADEDTLKLGNWIIIKIAYPLNHAEIQIARINLTYHAFENLKCMGNYVV